MKQIKNVKISQTKAIKWFYITVIVLNIFLIIMLCIFFINNVYTVVFTETYLQEQKINNMQSVNTEKYNQVLENSSKKSKKNQINYIPNFIN